MSGVKGSQRGAAQEEVPGVCTKPSTMVSPACQSTVSLPAWVSQMKTAQGLCNLYLLTSCVVSILVKVHLTMQRSCIASGKLKYS